MSQFNEVQINNDKKVTFVSLNSIKTKLCKIEQLLLIYT